MKRWPDTEDGRLSFHGFQGWETDDFGGGYDLFFVSNFLYGPGTDKSLPAFLQKVNRAMTMGGVFVSNHSTADVSGGQRLVAKIMELMTKAMGYPTICPRPGLKRR